MPLTRDRRCANATATLLLLAVAVRASLAISPKVTAADEGGYPFSVARWAVDGVMTYDFHTTPAYHVVLGAVFWLTGPSLEAARTVSVVAGLASLWLLWVVARTLLPDTRHAAWAVALWATCFPAADIGGRALIEPLQVLWMLGLLAAMLSQTRMAGLWVAVTAAGLLLTKINALPIVVACGLAMTLDPSPALQARRTAKLIGLASGLVLTGVVLWGLYQLDSATFMRGWGAAVLRPDVAATTSPRAGRIAISLPVIVKTIEYLGSQTPLFLALGVFGALRAVGDARVRLVGLALALQGGFFLVQAALPQQYLSVLYPLLALAGAGLLASVVQSAPRWRDWPMLALGVVMLDGGVRLAGSRLMLQQREAAAVTWLREHVSPQDRVLAAPYLLMQVPARGRSIFDLSDSALLPTATDANLGPVEWIVVDDAEWGVRIRRLEQGAARSDAALRDCCRLSYDDGFIRVYRTRTDSAP